MNNHDPSVERVFPLIEAACLGTISPRQRLELQGMLHGDAELQRVYLEYCRMHSELRCLCRASAMNHAVMERIAAGTETEFSEFNIYTERARPSASFPASVFGLLGGAYQGASGYLADHLMVFSYMVAVVCLSVAALVGSLVYVSPGEHSKSVVSGGSTPGASPERIKFEYVGKITGMKNCVWAKDSMGTLVGASVPFDRKYALSAGLLEITYTSGARVILEGPCVYAANSDAGGYLASGKLVARVEKKVASGQWLAAGNKGRGGTKPETRNPNPESPAPGPQPPAPLFSVTTPTAVVTDLGTEFGVEVGDGGETLSRVFRGSITVAPADDTSKAIVLGVNESAQVSRLSGQSRPSVKRTESKASLRFVRAMPRQPRGYLDLADIVAGGDGFGRARGRGIDSSTGTAVGEPIGSYGAEGDGRYHRVDGLPLIDGVFVPDSGRGPVQLDSAGHEFKEFPDTDNFTWGYIWSGVYPKVKNDVPSPTCWLAGVNYARPPHSVLCMPTNKGITFDLQAVRRANTDAEIRRFTAVAGNTEQRTLQGDPRYERVSADVWVFVDGQLRFSKKDFNSDDGPIPIDVSLSSADRFLTLAATDAGNTASFDWTMFGDPQLKISETIENRKEANTPQL